MKRKEKKKKIGGFFIVSLVEKKLRFIKKLGPRFSSREFVNLISEKLLSTRLLCLSIFLSLSLSLTTSKFRISLNEDPSLSPPITSLFSQDKKRR